MIKHVIKRNKKLKDRIRLYSILFFIGILVGILCRLTDFFPYESLWSFLGFICPCGNPSAWMEVEGRNDDVLCFVEHEQEIRVPPLAVYAKLKEVHMLRRFQVIKHPQNRVELRLTPMEKIAREDAFAAVSAALRELLSGYGVIELEIFLSEESPKQHPISGKFKHVINEP